MRTYTLVDIEKGRVFHFENYKSAINYRRSVDSGVIYRGDYRLRNIDMAIEKIRERWEKGDIW